MLSGPINSAETTATFPQRLCEDGLSVEVTREQRYGPSRLGADDDDDDDDWQRQRHGADVAASLRLSSLRRQPPQPRAVAETQLHGGGGGGGCGGAPRLGRVHARRLPAARPGPSPAAAAAGRALLAVSASATAVAAFIPARDDVVSAAAAIEQRDHVT